MGHIQKLIAYIRLGPTALAQAGLHRFRLSTGWYKKRTPPGEWGQRYFAGSCPWPTVFVGPLKLCDRPSLQDAVTRLSNGLVPWFGDEWRPIFGRWRVNPDNDFHFPCDHWSSLSQQSGDGPGDLKMTWEPSRFDWVPILMRAHAAKIPNAESTFQALLADWQKDNPPNVGPAYMCGQECSLRLLTLLRASGVFEPSQVLWETVAVLAERVEPSLAYALAQNNNHGISEALGLFAAGCALTQHPRASRWRALGSKIMERLCRSQFAPDGGYIQNSVMYERMALRLAINYVVLANEHHVPVSQQLIDRLRLAWRYLYLQQDEITGKLPNIGSNDGTNPLSFSACSYSDFRPVVASAAWVLEKLRIYPPGPWDEEVEWLSGADYHSAEPVPPPRHNSAFRQSGTYVLRNQRAMAVLRCQSYRSRPAQSDCLHVDLWDQGHNVLRDAGTWRYWHHTGHESFFPSTAAHNTLQVEGQDHMPRVSRFLLSSWVKDEVTDLDLNSPSPYVIGITKAYRRLGVIHKRKVALEEGLCRITDEISAKRGELSGIIRWRLDPDQTWTLCENRCYSDASVIIVDGPVQLMLVQPQTTEPDNLESTCYDHIQRIPLLRLRIPLKGDLTITTTVLLRPD